MRLEIVPYKAVWPEEFAAFAKKIRAVLGSTALAIHHIGSTSVPNLAAKDIIDMQITVANLAVPIQEGLESLGLVKHPTIDRDHCPSGMELEPSELQKRYYNNIERNMNIHIRASGRFNQRYPLLCRDYLRSHNMAADAYAEIKKQLVHYFPNNVDAYYDIKDPVFDVIMAGAFDWAEFSHWQIPKTDA